jgi:Flp pilus assembly pilin Flp
LITGREVKILKEMLAMFIKEEDGIGTVEIVVIIAVLVGIALIFRDAIIKFVTDIMKGVFADDTITNDVDSGSIRGDNQVN